jgi:hypothetical protein
MPLWQGARVGLDCLSNERRRIREWRATFPNLFEADERKAMATWSLCGRHAGPDKPPTPIFINLDNVVTVERQGDLTAVVMVGGEVVYIDTMPETFIGAVAPAGPV